MEGAACGERGAVHAGGDHRHADHAVQRRIEGGAEDDVGFRIDLFGDGVGRFVDFEHHVEAAGDVDQHGLGALQRDFVEQRVRDGVLAAIRARSSPVASPVPIIALPISVITVRTSAKSRLIRPGSTIRSVIEATPECSTWSAMPKASAKVVLSLATRNRFWFGMTIRVSTLSLQLGDAGVGQAHAVAAFEVEGLGDHAHRQDAALAGDLAMTGRRRCRCRRPCRR